MCRRDMSSTFIAEKAFMGGGRVSDVIRNGRWSWGIILTLTLQNVLLMSPESIDQGHLL